MRSEWENPGSADLNNRQSKIKRSQDRDDGPAKEPEPLCLGCRVILIELASQDFGHSADIFGGLGIGVSRPIRVATLNQRRDRLVIVPMGQDIGP